jgi:hypothetical protein
MLKGYAGSSKTTILKVDFCGVPNTIEKKDSLLMAPTGRYKSQLRKTGQELLTHSQVHL